MPPRTPGKPRLAGPERVVYRSMMVRTTIGPWVAGAALLAAVVAGCGDEPTYVEFAEVCGEAGPVRVLELSPGERLAAPPWKFGERVVYTIERRADDEAGKPVPSSSASRTVWTAGLCGEAPRRIAEGVEFVFTSEPMGAGMLLACDGEAGELLVLDAEGVAAPHVLFTGLKDCLFGWTPHGMVSVASVEEGDELPALGTLRLHRLPGDPLFSNDTVGATPLLENMRLRSPSGQSLGLSHRIFPDFVLAMTDEDDLVRVDLADGAVTTVQTGVVAFRAGGLDGRYVIWQDRVPTDDNRLFPGGKLFLRDREDGSDAFLGEAALVFSNRALSYIDRGLIFLRLAQARVFSMSDLSFVDLPPLGDFDTLIDERRVLMVGGWTFSVVDRVSGAAYTLYRSRGDTVRRRDGGLELLQVSLCCAGGTTRREEGQLWFVSYEGEARRLVERASFWGRTLADGRRVDTVDIGGDWRSSLQLADPETGAVRRIDEGVFAMIHVAPEVFGEDVVVYSIPGDERTGVWIARMPAG